MLSLRDRKQEDNYSAIIFDSIGQYATKSVGLVFKEMVFPCLCLLILCKIDKYYYSLLLG